MDSPIVFVLFLILAIVVGIVSWRASHKRRKDLSAWAAGHGLRFEDEKGESVGDDFPDFECLHQGDNRYHLNLMDGQWNGRELIGFDYHYETGSGKNRESHQFSAVIVGSVVPLKPLFIRPEGFFDKIAAIFGADEIKFESGEFSRRFCVKSHDRKWAYDVIHKRTIELLLASPVFKIKFSPTHVIAYHDNRFNPEQFGSAADVVSGILDRLPEYLVRQQEGQA